MAYSVVPTVSTSDSWTASQHNTYIKDNFAALFVGTTAGDTDYYTSATTKARLAIGSQYTLKFSTGSAPAWGSLATLTGLAATWSLQTGGDLVYASSSTALARLPVGALHTFLKSNASTPEYGAITYRRQGGSSTAWGTKGTTTYTPTSELQQIGVTDLNIVSGGGFAAVTFPTAYTANPHIMLTVVSISSGDQFSAPYIYALSTTGFTVGIQTTTGSSSTIQINWVARGQ